MVKKNLKKIIISVVCLVFIAIVGWFIGKPMLELVREPEDFRAWVQDLGFLGRLAYVGMLVFQIIFALIPGEPFEIVAGYAFGAVEGTILCLIGSAIGSIIVFALVRAFGKRFVELFFSLDKINELKFLKDSKKRDALSFIIHKDKAYGRARKIAEKLKDNIPRQMFEIPIQIAIGGKVIARETVKAMRKDVLAKCYGGDITRKKKLLEKQKEGKKRMRSFGTVEVPQEAFMAILKLDED